jgi:uncharacterized protein YjiK
MKLESPGLRTKIRNRELRIAPSQRRPTFESLEGRALLAGFNFVNFDDPAPLTLLGDASITPTDRLRLTPAAGGQEGAAWYTLEKQYVGFQFSTTFQFQLADNFDSPGGSDGFVFLIQNSTPTFLAGGGGTLGYYGLPNSLAVEFDTFQNSEVSDPSGSHISVHTNGTGPNDWRESLSLGSYNTNPIMDDAQVHTAKITYAQKTLSIFLDNLSTPKLTVSVDLADKLSLDAGRAWIGFTGTTGGGYQTHDILNWSFDSMIPATMVNIGDASLSEGDSGAEDLVFTVTRSGDLAAAATVNWRTQDGTATAASGDYGAASGQISFAPGETTQSIAVKVNGDTAVESHEMLSVVLSSAVGAAILDGNGVGTILNDETTITISDAVATEGDTSLRYVDNFVSDSSGGILSPFGVTYGPDGNLYVSQSTFGGVKRFNGITGQFIDVFADGSSVANQASQMIFRDGYLFVATGTTGILRFDAHTGAPAPADGKVGAQFVTPADQGIVQGVHGLAFGPDGQLYVTSNVSNQVLKYDSSSGAFLAIYVDAGSGGLMSANALTFGADGHLYVASSGNSSVLRFQGPLEANPGAFLDTFVPSGTGGLTWIPTGGLRFGPDGDLYVVSRDSNSVLRFDRVTGALREQAVSASEGGLLSPRGIAFDSAGRLLVVSANTNAVLRYAPASEAAFTVSIAYPSSAPVSVNYTTAIGTATTVDFTSAPGTLTFAPGQTSRTILVQTLDDSNIEGSETFTVTLSDAVGAAITDTTGVATITDDDIPPTKFYVVDDGSTNKTFEYESSGGSIENYAVNGSNSTPRGAASAAAGDKVWIVDGNKNVYVYDPAGKLLGSWTAGSLNAAAQVEGIATNGTDVWIVDAKQDKVFRYAGAASRLSGSQNAASSFSLNKSNTNAKDVVTDGSNIWVVDNSSTDKVFKYTVGGSLLGSWTITSGGGSPTGITIDPSGVSDSIWIVDSASDLVYDFTTSRDRISGSQSPAKSFALAAGNTNPQGIADPPSASASAATASSTKVATTAFDSALLAVVGELDDMLGSDKKRR